MDNLSVVGKRPLFYAFMGGVVFNLANILLVAAISIAGLAVAFPIGIGLALVIGVVWNYWLNPQGHPGLLFAGAAVVVAAILVDAMAYGQQAKVKRGTPVKGILISLISGILMGSFYPLVELSKQGDLGLGAYSVALIFSIGVFLSTFFFNLYFMNLPIQDSPIGIGDYFAGTKKQHLLGVAGGIIWAIGMISNFVAASTPRHHTARCRSSA